MIKAVTGMALVACAPVASKTSGDVAHYVEESLAEGRADFEGSFYIGLSKKILRAELDNVFLEHREPGWDGDGALPVLEISYERAKEFVEALPLGVAAPALAADPAGHLTLEWHHSLRRTLSVSIGPDNFIHYAALFGVETIYGSVPFFDEIPPIVIELISEVTRADA